jgi:PurA-like ssDNA and RNA-binding protein
MDRGVAVRTLSATLRQPAVQRLGTDRNQDQWIVTCQTKQDQRAPESRLSGQHGNPPSLTNTPKRLSYLLFARRRPDNKFPKTRRFCFHFGLRLPKLGALKAKMDNIIEARELQIERKHFYVELRENERGRFLRITEEAHGRRNSIIVPSTGVDEFTATISEVLTNGETAPA